MITKYMYHIASIVCLLIFCGCVSEPGTVETHWGKAFETAKYQQLSNPDADKNLAAVEGLDGEASEKNMTSYRKSFDTSDKSSIYNINLTGIVGK